MPYLYHGYVNPHADSADSTLTRPSNWNARLQYGNFGATGPSGTDTIIRETLTAARTYYVRTDGSDSNNGLTNTAGGAFLTLQHAANVILTTLDQAENVVTIQIADGTYAGASFIAPSIESASPTNYYYIVVNGNAATPSNVVITASTGGSTLTVGSGIAVNFKNFQVTSTGTLVDCIHATYSSQVNISGVDFGVCSANHVDSDTGAYIGLQSYTISGGATLNHLSASLQGTIFLTSSATISGNPTFTNAFAYCDSCGLIALYDGVSYVGAATGKRYQSSSNGCITPITTTLTETTFPGDSVGSCDGGGIYDLSSEAWTPVVTFATPGDLNVVYSTQTGKFTRDGDLITFTANIVTTTFTHTTASGDLQITGLPYAAVTTGVGVGTISINYTKANYTQLQLKLGASLVTVIATGSGQAVSSLAATDLPSATNLTIYLSGYYQTD